MEFALKPSMRTELSFQQKTLCEEILYLNGNNGVSGEDFSVDDLLDLSHDEFQHHALPENDNDFDENDDDEYEEKKDGSSVSDDLNSNSGSDSGAGDSDSVFASELAVPVDDLADLEWVSHFVDDSLPEFSFPVFPGKSSAAEENHPTAEITPEFSPAAKTPKIPVKSRSTKHRKGNGRVWSQSSVLFAFVAGESPAARQKRRKTVAEGEVGGAQFQRRCSHCHVQKTPQWRTGPLGAKTLCNACGVRFKSGRLFPEYRPACSPTFSSDLHSNSHRKVLEMRRKKDAVGPEAGSAQTQTVRSF